MRVKMICFDMDGTIANLYGVKNWLPMLQNHNPIPYVQCAPMWDMNELAKVLQMLQAKGIEIRIVTWLAKDSTKTYDEMVRFAKRDWLADYKFPFDHFHGVKYGTTKANCVRKYLAENETAILIDDNEQVRKGWRLGDTLNPTECNIIEELRKLL